MAINAMTGALGVRRPPMNTDAELMGTVGAGLPTQAVTAARQRMVQSYQGAQNKPVIQQGNAGLGGTYGRVDPRVADRKYDYTNPTYQGNAKSWIDGLNDQMRYAPQQSLEGAGTGGVELPFTMQKYGDQTVRYMPDGTYQVIDNRQAFESDRTAADIYDATGKFLGGQYIDNRQSGLGKGIDSLVKAATVAMIGGGIAGGFGVGPMASGGAPATGTAGAGAAGGAGAGGIGAAAGDAGLMYAGADAAAAGYLGSAPATLGGSVAGAGSVAGGLSGATAGDAGLMYAGQNAASTMGLGSAPATLGGSVSGTTATGAGGWMDLIKSGASKVFGGGSGGGGGMFDWGDVFSAGTKLASSYMQSNAADKAAEAQILANQQSMQMLEPWRQGGAWAMGRAGDMLGRSGSRAAQAAFYKDPGYQFRVNEGQKLIDRDKARGGKFFSGERGKALVNYGQNMGSQEFTNAFNRYMAMSGMGQTAANTSGGYASAMGDSRAAADIARANTWGNALTGMYDTWRQNQMMDRFLG